MEVAAAATNPVIKVVCLCGSIRKASTNRGLIRFAIELSKESVEGMQIVYLDVSVLPMLNTDLEVDGTFPPVVEAFRRKVLEADSVLFASPEYNYSVSPPLKNAIDWGSRPPNCWGDKAAAILSASGGSHGWRSQMHLRQIGVSLNIHFINKPEFLLHGTAPPAKFDRSGNLTDPEVKEKVKEMLVSLRAFTLRLKESGSKYKTWQREKQREVVGAAAKPVINAVALSGSLRKGSVNRGLLRAAIDISKESVQDLQIEYLDISSLPMVNTDLEVGSTFPPVVEAFRKKIFEADSVIFVSPEYNYSVTAPLKNAIDWASRPPNCWADKAAAVVSAGGGFGGARSQYHLRQIGVFIDLHFINQPEFFLKAFAPPAKFDSDGNLIDSEAKEKLKQVLISLYAFSLRLKADC
ncbi:hypothetical protein K2173_009685 [Erythroxylum novogranatense]|uniref:NAD(P)H dehydrogenase (quinone) n=1 Tax=Erythroxylum novogranatense TaxID=1862640 RepID=A0AAV8U836_9ROSI|nr:hypothetical protein K2173_009685 [Erythroxylum novogranatense]